MNVQFFFRLVGMVVFGLLGWQIGTLLDSDTSQVRLVLVLTLAGAALGSIIAPYFTTKPYNYARKLVKLLPVVDLIASGIGLVVGLVIAALLTIPFSRLPGVFGSVLPFVSVLIFGYLGIIIMVLRKREVFEFFGLNRAANAVVSDARGNNAYARSILIDTSAIIDGRIADVSQTGFLEGTLIIPNFVLRELQHLADSSNSQNRTRGRRGLEMLNKLNKDSIVPIQVSDVDTQEVDKVDDKLVKIAKSNHYALITTDYNLNRVAELQGVKVLNVNELAQSVRPVVLPGEEINVKVIQEGKEQWQGLAYLDDGTMIVIENGRRYIGQEINITITRVLQTVAGRMIFAQMKSPNEQS